VARKSNKRPPPRSLRRLAPHQGPAFAYCRVTKDPALLMEMRLGKTLVTIRAIKLYRPRNPEAGLRVLVLAPSTVLSAWAEELALEGEKEVVWLVGDKGPRLADLAAWDATWYLANKEAHLSIGHELARARWDAVVLDEHFIKNPSAKVTKHLIKNYRRVPHRWWLTGTPAPEGELDLVCPMLWLDGRAFGYPSYWTFRARKFTKFVYDWIPKPGVRERMLKVLGERAFILRRGDVDMDQPKVYQRRVFELPPRLRRAYDTLEDEWLIEMDGRERARTKWRMVQYNWLRRMCGGFVPAGGAAIDGVFKIPPVLEWDGMIRELVWLMNGELKGQQVVVWASYNAELFACAEVLVEAGIKCNVLNGDVKPMARAKVLAKFRNGEFDVLLCQTELAKYGVNLSAASVAIYYSGPLGTETRSQSEDRVVVAGREDAVLIIDFVVKDTISWFIYEMLVYKKEASAGVTYLARAMAKRRAND
jgi:hypothetical protein